MNSIILVRQTSNVNSSSAPIVRNYTQSFRYYWFWQAMAPSNHGKSVGHHPLEPNETGKEDDVLSIMPIKDMPHGRTVTWQYKNLSGPLFTGWLAGWLSVSFWDKGPRRRRRRRKSSSKFSGKYVLWYTQKHSLINIIRIVCKGICRGKSTLKVILTEIMWVGGKRLAHAQYY